MSILDKIPIPIEHHKVGDRFTLNKVRIKVCKAESFEDCNICYFNQYDKVLNDADCKCPPFLSCSAKYNNGNEIYYKQLGQLFPKWK